jgi:hypothetical protein
MSRGYSVFSCGLFAVLIVLTPQPAAADLSGFVGTIGFEKDLERSLGFGLRWGRSSGIIGGETAVMISSPTRNLGGAESTATTIFYEGRMLVNIPLKAARPFFGIGFGQIIITSTEVPRSVEAGTTRDAFKEASKLQVSNAFSYGGGVRYELNNRVDLRADVRQYVVFSVAGLAADALVDQIEDSSGVDLPVEDSTVSYEEVSIGLNFRF